MQRPNYCLPNIRDRGENDRLPQLGPIVHKPRRQRPLSFDEKELQHNIKIVKTRRRPNSFDERELQRNEAVNAQLRMRYHREAFTKPARPIVIPTSDSVDDANTMQGEGEVRISFVNASDLYDLVDINRQIKGNKNAGSSNGSVKLVNVPDAVQFVHDIEAKKNDLQKEQESENVNKLKKNRCVKINVNLNTDLFGKKEHKSAKQNSSVRPEIEKVTPLSIFLQQAVSEFANQNALNVRPKRAKRMSLRKPSLLDIPEDGDSTAQHGCQECSAERSKVRHPTSISLQAIKEVREEHDKRTVDLENGKLILGPRHKETVKTEESLSNNSSPRKYKHKRTNKSSQPDLDLDKLLMTSIYPTVPWSVEVESDQPSGRHFSVPEKSSHKEKAHRKMKKLIFLRDRPDQHYRRDA